MKEIEFFAHNPKTESPEQSASHLFSDEVYAFAKDRTLFSFRGDYTRWELLEGAVELAGAIALVRFGATRIPKWFPSTPKPIVWPEVPTIMSSPIPGSIAKNHPIMRTVIRTNAVIEQTRPMV